MGFIEQQSTHDEEHSSESLYANPFESYSYEEVFNYAETHNLSYQGWDLKNFYFTLLED